MSSIETLVQEHFPDAGAVDIPEIASAVIGYMFRVRSSAHLTDAVREHIPDARVTAFRKSLQTAYYLRNVKLWLWQVVMRDLSRTPAARVMQTYEVQSPDIVIAEIVMADPELLASIRSMEAYYRPEHRLTVYDAFMDSILDELDGHIRRFVYRKLRFITYNGSVSLEDLVTDMKACGLYAMRLQYPKVESRLHLVNVCKNAVHNFGMNLIQTNTTKGRGHLRWGTGGTTEVVKISTNQGGMFGGPGTFGDEDGFLGVVGHASDLTGTSLAQGGPEYGDLLQVRLAVERLDVEGQRFAHLLQGHYDRGFSQWLHQQDLPDNDELMDRWIANDHVKRYVALTRDYLGLSEYRSNVVMNQIRASL